jgi:hypothetical protein
MLFIVPLPFILFIIPCFTTIFPEKTAFLIQEKKKTEREPFLLGLISKQSIG